MHDLAASGSAPPFFDGSDPDRLIRVISDANNIGIVVAGDLGRNQSRVFNKNRIQGPRIGRTAKLLSA